MTAFPSGYNAPNNINNGTGPTNPMAWNYELLSSLWLREGWISNYEAQYASTHYGAYAATTKQGLKIISINTGEYIKDDIKPLQKNSRFLVYTKPLQLLQLHEPGQQRRPLLPHLRAHRLRSP